MKRVYAIILVLLMASAVGAATYYVDDANGLDTNPGTEAQPWLTLNRAYTKYSGAGDKVTEGDTVLFKNGNYGQFTEESTQESTVARRTEWITYKAATGHTPVLTSVYINNQDKWVPKVVGQTRIIFDGFSIENGANVKYTEYIQFLNCIVTRIPQSLIAMGYPNEGYNAPYVPKESHTINTDAASHVTISDCNVTAGSVCLYSVNGTDFIMTGNELHYIGENGIKFGSPVSDCNMENNYIYDYNKRRAPEAISGVVSGVFEVNDVVTQASTGAEGVVHSIYTGLLAMGSSYLDSHCGDTEPNTLARALDGQDYWSHDVNETHYFILDLGISRTLRGVQGRSNTEADPTAVNIYVSDSKADWGEAVASNIATWQDTTGYKSVAIDNAPGRYIKVEVTATEAGGALEWGSTGTSFTIFKIEVVDCLSVYETLPAHFLDTEDGGGIITGPDDANMSTITIVDPPHTDGIGFQGSGVYRVIIRGNTIIGRISQGIKMENNTPGSMDDFLLENNLIYSDGKSLSITSITNLRLLNNTFLDAPNPSIEGLWVKCSTGTTTITEMFNNIIDEFWIFGDVRSYTNRVVNHGHNVFMTAHPGGVIYPFSVDEANEIRVADIRALFTDADANDFTLAESSIAINFGDDAYAPILDILGNPRVGTADAGAYEYQTPLDPNNHRPDITDPGPKSVLENRVLSFDIEASDEDEDDLVYSFGGVPPPGAVLVGNAFTWQPTYRQSGDYIISFSVTDGIDPNWVNVPITITNVPQGWIMR